MLETYFSAPKMLAHLRNGPSGSFIDGFAQSLERSGYRPAIAVRYLRAAAHLGHFACEQGGTLADINLAAFHEHLRTCRCPRAKGGRRNHHTTFGAKNFLNFLQQIGVHRTNATPAIQSPEPALVVSFQHWLRKHRGAAEPTIRQYARGATRLMMALGTDPTGWNATAVRRYFLERTGQGGKSSVEKLITSLRVFLRYLAVQGLCQADLDKAVPAYASWRLAELPRYLTAEQVVDLLTACDGDSAGRRRDRAILLLLARLGLRAGDVAQLRLADIEWEAGTLLVCGKSGYQVRLPLPQEVGDAIIAYMECRPTLLRVIASSFETSLHSGHSSMVAACHWSQSAR